MRVARCVVDKNGNVVGMKIEVVCGAVTEIVN